MRFVQDIWSFVVTIFEANSGKMALRSCLPQTLQMAQNEAAYPWEGLNGPEAFAASHIKDLVLACLARDPDERPTADRVVHDHKPGNQLPKCAGLSLIKLIVRPARVTSRCAASCRGCAGNAFTSTCCISQHGLACSIEGLDWQGLVSLCRLSYQQLNGIALRNERSRSCASIVVCLMCASG